MINTLKAPAIAGMTGLIALSTFLFAHEGHDHSQDDLSRSQPAANDRQPASVNNQAPPMQTIPQSSAPPAGTLPPGHSPDDGHDHSNHSHDRSDVPGNLRPLTDPNEIYPSNNGPYFESPGNLPGYQLGTDPNNQTQFNSPYQLQNEFHQGSQGHHSGCHHCPGAASDGFTCHQSRGTCPQTYQQHYHSNHDRSNHYGPQYEPEHFSAFSSDHCNGIHSCPFGH